MPAGDRNKKLGSEQLQLFFLALAPSLFWLWWFWSQDRDRDELEPLARAFVFGAVAVIPCSILEFVFLGGDFTPSTLQCFFLIGPIEELCKLLATLLAVGRDRSFDDPADGIVFGAAAALGFAFAENLYYFAVHNSAHVFVVRSGFSVPSHVLAAVPWAVALGKIKCDELAPKRLIVSGLVVASILHGMYDALCFQIHYQRDVAVIALLALTLAEWRFYMLSMKETFRLGRRLIRRRMLASRTWKKHEKDPPTGFNYRWCFIPLVGGLLIGGISWVGFFPILRQEVPLPLHVDLVIVTVLMLITGIVTAYFSPGRTEKEAALGLALGGFCLSFITGWPSHDPMESGVYFALLGAFGGWLGEMLQSNQKKPAQPS
jgi:RsiW-degrading membrane proteinase PrsW (M82 family)